MKKQLLIAAVAATMSVSAMADVSITGDAKVNWTNVDHQTDSSDSNTFKHDINLTVAGKNGDTGVLVRTSTTENTVNDNTASTALTLEDAYVTSKIGDVNVKFGQYNTTSDSNISDATNSTIAAGRFTADYTYKDVKVTFVDQNDSGEAIILSGDVAGVSISHKMANGAATGDYTDSKISADLSGIGVSYRTKNMDNADNSTNSDLTVAKVTASISGFDVVVVDAEASHASDTFTSEGDMGALGAYNNYTGVKVSTSIAGNTVAYANVATEDTAGTSGDDYNKVIVTRPLASGATFEATYTDKDDSTSGSDEKTLDLELAVKF